MMQEFIIHLAIGKLYAQKNPIENWKAFENGIIMPDLRGNSNYGTTVEPDLSKFLQTNLLTNEYNMGFFITLVANKLFYSVFLKELPEGIEDDIDILNKFLIEKYEIEVPEKVKDQVVIKEGELKIIDKESIVEFIEAVSNLTVREVFKFIREFSIENKK